MKPQQMPLAVLFAALAAAGCVGAIAPEDADSLDEPFGGALVAGASQTFTGTVSASGTRSRRYTVGAEANGELVFKLRWSGSANLDLRLFDESGTRIDQAETKTPNYEELRYPWAESGEVVKIAVRAASGSASYTLEVSLVAGGVDAGPSPIAACGDGVCSAVETCAACAADCGACATPPPAPATWWKPTNDKPLHMHWQLSQEFSFPRDVVPGANVYDIDGETTTKEEVAALHALGPDVKVICYFDAGVYETYRSDAYKFPASVIGNEDVGWDGSYWLDIRQLDVILPILRDRMINWCKNKGFDAIEPDETEVWSNNPGFPITKEQNNAFNKAIADMAHELGLSVGLKGNNTEAAELEPYFDWALTEECWQYNECQLFRDSFAKKGKAVFAVDYKATPNCTSSNLWKLNAMKRDLNLMGPTSGSYLYQPCIPNTQNAW